MNHTRSSAVRRILVSGAAVAFACSVAAGSARGQDSHRLSGGSVAIWNLAGEVTVVGGSGSDVTVEISRGGSDSGQLRIEKGMLSMWGEQWQTLRVVYPSDEVVYRELSGGSRTTLRVGEDGTFYDRGDRWGEKVTIKGSGNGLEAHADLRISVPRGKRLRVALAAGKVDVSNVDGDINIDVGSAPITSRNTKGELSLDTGSGRIKVEGAEGDVSLDTGSGAVEVSDVDGDELNVDTGSGSVSGGNVSVRDLNVDTGSGKVNLRQVRARSVFVDTGSGGVDLELLTDVRELAIDTGSGGVTITVPDDFGAEMEIETGSGGIDVDLGPVSGIKTERGYFRGVVGTGDGEVSIETGSGGVRLSRN
jgi:lia operon protein LiaG